MDGRYTVHQAKLFLGRKYKNPRAMYCDVIIRIFYVASHSGTCLECCLVWRIDRFLIEVCACRHLYYNCSNSRKRLPLWVAKFHVLYLCVLISGSTTALCFSMDWSQGSKLDWNYSSSSCFNFNLFACFLFSCFPCISWLSFCTMAFIWRWCLCCHWFAVFGFHLRLSIVWMPVLSFRCCIGFSLLLPFTVRWPTSHRTSLCLQSLRVC